MSRLKSNIADWALSLLFGVAVFLFWWRSYPFALSYHEQFQLFLFGGDYLVERLGEPGGAARYLSEFLVQFYNNVLAGAAVIAVLLVLMQRLVRGLMLNAQPSTLNPPRSTLNAPRSTLHAPLFSFLLPLLIWYMMGDDKLLLAFPVAIIMVQALMLLCRPLAQRGVAACAVVLAIAVPVGYWLCGPVVLALAVLPVLTIRDNRMVQWLMALGVVGYVALCVWGSSLLVPYTVSQLFCGLGYYRFFEVMLLTMVLAVLLMMVLPVVARHVHTQNPGIYAGLATLMILLGWFLVPSNFDERTYELIEYDYLVRTQQWDAVIAKAEQKTPDLPMSVCATNLALAMKGQLTERAFDFYQRGSEGLLPKFERNYASILTTGEAYFQLGLVNMAQLFAFEAMEAIPNYNKSVRCVRRLAETNLINGEYDVARKYLKMLKKTMFYSKWAQRTEALLGNEPQIAAHPLYGKLRSMRIREDFLYSDRELDKICGQLVMANPDNTVAEQYLLMYPVLDRDVNRFMNYFQFVQQQRPTLSSRICLEMVTFAYASRQQQPPQGAVPERMLQQYNQFIQEYRTGGPLATFRTTAWYYLLKGQ